MIKSAQKGLKTCGALASHGIQSAPIWNITACRAQRAAIAVKTGEGGKLFGAVTSNDIHEKLVAAGITIEKRRIHLGDPIKTLGKHEVKIKLHAEVSVELSIDVVSENPIEPAAQ